MFLTSRHDNTLQPTMKGDRRFMPLRNVAELNRYVLMAFVLAVLSALTPVSVLATIGFHDILPVKLYRSGEDLIFEFIDYGLEAFPDREERKIVLHIRYHPRCVSNGDDPGHGTKEEYESAVKLLRQHVSKGQRIIFGFHGNIVKDKPGHYQAENLKVMGPLQDAIVWSVRSSHGVYACELGRT